MSYFCRLVRSLCIIIGFNDSELYCARSVLKLHLLCPARPDIRSPQSLVLLQCLVYRDCVEKHVNSLCKHSVSIVRVERLCSENIIVHWPNIVVVNDCKLTFNVNL